MDVYAAQSGVVIEVKTEKDYGRKIIIDHRNGWKTLYAHLSQFKVKLNDLVTKGQVIGKVGNSGQSHGSHLHFETYLASITTDLVVDPLSFHFKDIDYKIEIYQSPKKSAKKFSKKNKN